jgi:hypothetical protein
MHPWMHLRLAGYRASLRTTRRGPAGHHAALLVALAVTDSEGSAEGVPELLDRLLGKEA